MRREIALSCLLVALVALFLVPTTTAEAGSYSQFDEYYRRLNEEEPQLFEEIMKQFRTYLQNEEYANKAKRGLDLGLSRGFSGSQAAKHLMGLAAANYAGGPGRRRRSEQA
ncbi:diuretic hormone class 2 [Prorops nasuta]|uniref:diuretic hormone class 2 n=1 Tax=Prorops nasuta TaxID=863751 RepID=UPI0034CF3087